MEVTLIVDKLRPSMCRSGWSKLLKNNAGGNFGTGVRASILKPTLIIYLAFENNSLFIYLISQKVDLYIYCPLN